MPRAREDLVFGSMKLGSASTMSYDLQYAESSNLVDKIATKNGPNTG
jgi:hypothetical protein